MHQIRAVNRNNVVLGVCSPLNWELNSINIKHKTSQLVEIMTVDITTSGCNVTYVQTQGMSFPSTSKPIELMTHIYSYIFFLFTTNSIEQRPSWEAESFRLSTNSVFYGILTLTAVYLTTHHQSLSYVRWIQSTPSN
jgi:hypothetical protein